MAGTFGPQPIWKFALPLAAPVATLQLDHQALILCVSAQNYHVPAL